MPILSMSLLVAGDVTSFDRGAFTAAFASRIGVNAALITLYVSGASIAVTAHVRAPIDAAARESIMQAMADLVATTDVASAALGVTAEAVTAAAEITSAVMLLSPSPSPGAANATPPAPGAPTPWLPPGETRTPAEVDAEANQQGGLVGGVVGGLGISLLLVAACYFGLRARQRAREGAHPKPSVYGSGVDVSAPHMEMESQSMEQDQEGSMPLESVAAPGSVEPPSKAKSKMDLHGRL